MATSPLWPKPPRWPLHPNAVDPNQRWVWHTRPRFILPLWEHASAGAAQRYVRLAPTRRTARTWQLNTGAAAMRTPWGTGRQHSDGQRGRDRGACRQQSKLHRLGAERALYDRSTDQRSLGWHRNQAPVPVGEFQHRRSHPVPHVRHDAEPAAPGQWWRHGHDHVVRRDRDRYRLVDARRDLATGTPRAVRGRLLACLEYRGGYQPQRLVRHLPLGLGLLDLAGLQRRHRAHRVFRLILDPRHGAAVARRSVRLPAPMGRAACAHGERTPATPPSTGTGVVTFLMG
jgi:hypothetical protein